MSTDPTSLPTLVDMQQSKKDMDDINTFTSSTENTFVDNTGRGRRTMEGVVSDVHIGGKPYESTAAGIAATVSGDYFSVVSANDNNYLDLYKNESGVAEFKKSYPSIRAMDRVTDSIQKVFDNKVAHGDFIGGEPEKLTSYEVVTLTTQSELLSRGYNKAVKWRSGTTEYSKSDEISNLNGSYVGGCTLFYSENPDNLPPDTATMLYSEDSDGTSSVMLNSTVIKGVIPLSSNLVLFYQYGKIDQSGAINMRIGLNQAPVDAERYTTGLFVSQSQSPFNIADLVDHFFTLDKTRLSNLDLINDLNLATKDDVSNAGDIITSYVDTIFDNPFKNDLIYGDFVGGTPIIRSGESLPADLPFSVELQKLGFTRGLNWRVGGNEYVIKEYDETITGRDIFISFYVYSENPSNMLETANVFSANASGALSSMSPSTVTKIEHSANLFQFTSYATVTQAGAVSIVVGSSVKPVSDAVYATGFHITCLDGTHEKSDGIKYVNVMNTIRSQGYGQTLATSKIIDKQSGSSSLTLNGTGEDSFITGYKGDDEIKRVIQPFHNKNILRSQMFNFNGDYINGEVVKTGGDDIAPYRAMGTTIGANHGYFLGLYQAPSHGKTDDDIGSIYTKGGRQQVLTGVVDSDSLYIMDMDNPFPISEGLFEYVSGGVNTDDISTTSKAQKQFYTPRQNYRLDIKVDGKDIAGKKGVFIYDKSVVFNETYEIVDRDAMIQTIINDKTTYPSGHDANFVVNIIYSFDKEANCTIYTDFLTLKETPLADIMFIQAARQELTRYYFPKALPFTHSGLSFDYANIEPSDKLSSNGADTVFFDSSNTEPAGILLDRVVGFNDTSNTCFTMGYLPLQDASVVERRVKASAMAFEVRGNTDKLYPRAIDQDDQILSVGDYFSVIAYRNVFKKPIGRTSNHVVRTNGDDYVYVDWHVSGLDRVPMSDDLVGREFDIVEKSDNVTLYSKAITSHLSVSVDSSSSYGYLILKVKK